MSPKTALRVQISLPKNRLRGVNGYRFTHVGQGLAFRHGEKLQGFMIAGEDKQFVWADAVIDGDTVAVSSQQVQKPVAVRYAWSGRHPWANLFNKDGLPAQAFRTDEW